MSEQGLCGGQKGRGPVFVLLKMIKDNLGDTNFVYHFTKQAAVSVPKDPEK